MRSLRLVLLLVPALLSLAATPPDPLIRLKTACEKSKDLKTLNRELKALAPTLGFELEESIADPESPEDGRITLRFRRPIPAARLLAAMGWTRAYAFSGDVHQETWSIALWTADLPEDENSGGPSIGIKEPRIGAWTLTPNLAGLPAGDLPKLSAGASAAYDLSKYPAMVAEIVIVPADTSLDSLAELKTACEKSKDLKSLDGALKTLAPTLGFELQEDINHPHPERPGENRFILRFRRPIPAENLLAVMGWTRAYAVPADVHQETWSLRLWTSDLPESEDLPGPHIGTQDPHVGAWAFMPSLAGRPDGDLPTLLFGFAPAYDLNEYEATVTEVKIAPWSADWN